MRRIDMYSRATPTSRPPAAAAATVYVPVIQCRFSVQVRGRLKPQLPLVSVLTSTNQELRALYQELRTKNREQTCVTIRSLEFGVLRSQFCVSLSLSTPCRLLSDWDDAESLVKLNVLSSHFLAPLLIDGAVLAVGRLLV